MWKASAPLEGDLDQNFRSAGLVSPEANEDVKQVLFFLFLDIILSMSSEDLGMHHAHPSLWYSL